jgi:hypothetical protein
MRVRVPLIWTTNMKSTSKTHDYVHVNVIQTNDIRGGTQKFPELLKNLFKLFVQIWNFSPFQSTAPVTGCSNPCDATTAENIV